MSDQILPDQILQIQLKQPTPPVGLARRGRFQTL
jgi:hypothetical protein